MDLSPSTGLDPTVAVCAGPVKLTETTGRKVRGATRDKDEGSLPGISRVLFFQ